MNDCGEPSLSGLPLRSGSGAFVMEELPVKNIDQTFGSWLGVQCIYQLNVADFDLLRTLASSHSVTRTPVDVRNHLQDFTQGQSS
jgi:hypothetical protein